MITIELPWPPKELNPNKWLHWAIKARARDQAGSDAYYLAMDVKASSSLMDSYQIVEGKNLRATWTFHPPALYHYDEDNLVRACKPYQDGVCAALGIDDHQIKDTARSIAEVDRPNGRVVMTLEAM